MPQEIKMGKSNKSSLLNGVNKISAPVVATLGPKGRNIVIEREFSGPLITNDGVSIAKAIELEDKYENLAAQILKEAAVKTNDKVGDGTTTSVVLAKYLINYGFLNEDDLNVIELRDGMYYALDKVCEELKRISIPIKTSEDIYNVAKISSGRHDIGKLIQKAMDIIGKDGVITVKESSSVNTSLDITSGMNFNSGFISPLMASNTNKMETVLDNCLVFITKKILSSINDVIEPLKYAMEKNRPILIICKNLEGEALQTVSLNNLRGTLKAVAVKAPFGSQRDEMLIDIATVCNAVVDLTEMESYSNDFLGKAESVIVNSNSTTIIEKSNAKEVVDRADKIKDLISKEKENLSEYDLNEYSDRLAKLVGGIATINVGAPTEIEMKELKLRIEDSINATKAAVEEGIVPGGGAALMSCVPCLSSLDKEILGSKSFIEGINAVENSLLAPMEQILINAGKSYNSLPNEFKFNEALDVDKLEFVDMIKSGIIDPVKVTRYALTNAVSVASTLLTTEGSIINIKEDNNSNNLGSLI